MNDEAIRIALVVVALAFVALVAMRGILPALRARRDTRPARFLLSRQVSIASDEGRPAAERAAALVKAGRVALGDLRKPRIAAHHAEWAHRLAPADPDVVTLAIDALGPIRAHARLERLLWISLDASEGAARDRVLEALAVLYEGPMHRPERARALRRLAGKG